MKSCLICEDHDMMRGALSGCVSVAWPDILVLEAKDFRNAWLMAKEQSPDLILCDLVMPGAKPREGISGLMAAAPGIPVIVVTGVEQDDLLIELLEMGIAGFIPKTSTSEVIELAIRLVLAGERYVPQRVIELASIDPCHRSIIDRLVTVSSCELTERQLEGG
jgi:two-component system, NarL family, nitrate/nitrite response regulator NarL